MKEIYPQIKVLRIANGLVYSARVRKKDSNGIYWLCHVVKNYPDYGYMDEVMQVNDFHRICYIWVIDGVPVSGMYLNDGSLLWEVDENQEEESDRVSKAYKFGL